MQPKQFALMCCAGALLLVLVPASYAADAPADVAANPPPEATVAPADTAVMPSTDASSPPQPQVAAETSVDERMSSAPAKPAEKTAMATSTALPVVSDPGRVYLIRENPFFNLHIEKAVQHAREAEIAGNMGETALLLEHAKMSLMQAHEAQRAGNVPGLNEGIANLKQALNLPVALTQTSQPSSAMGTADPRCIDELQRECGDVQPGSGRIQQCFDDKINNFSPMCQEKLKEGKAATAASITQTRHEQSVSGTQRTEAAVRSATAHVREARKSLSEAGGLKFKEIQPPVVTTVSTDK